MTNELTRKRVLELNKRFIQINEELEPILLLDADKYKGKAHDYYSRKVAMLDDEIATIQAELSKLFPGEEGMKELLSILESFTNEECDIP